MTIRRAGASIFVILTLGLVGYTVGSYMALNLKEGFAAIPYNELTKAAIDGKKELSKNLFDIGLLLLAALWGLIIAKKGESGIVLSGDPELVAFICASLLLLLSLLAHILYSNALLSGFADSGLAIKEGKVFIIDLFDKKVNYFFVMQAVNLIAGAVVATATLLSAHKLK